MRQRLLDLLNGFSSLFQYTEPPIRHNYKEIFCCLADGITYSFGIFLVELIAVFDADRGAVSLIPSILVGVTLGSGRESSTSIVSKHSRYSAKHRL
jgi:hypothetical protein